MPTTELLAPTMPDWLRDWDEARLDHVIDGKREFVEPLFKLSVDKLNELWQFIRDNCPEPPSAPGVLGGAAENAYQHSQFLTGTLGYIAGRKLAIVKKYKRANPKQLNDGVERWKKLMHLPVGAEPQGI